MTRPLSPSKKKLQPKPLNGRKAAQSRSGGSPSDNSKPEEMRAAIRAAIRSIPRGKVATYGSVARAAGFANGARQTAATLHHSIGLPWHRVLGAGGEIKLRGDSAFEQRFRLQAEAVTFRGRRVDMARHEFKFPRAQPLGAAKTRMTGNETASRRGRTTD
jgi:methylated-DNA-protein-cysteine methyltransferase-like protein